ncbi:MAG: efflux RND transporter periplasmic adaptor subunit [Pedobacter sp.]|nr:MAG: efflux RND transporter periplasmic adaptor subunit [Pedobacter sp.]
MKKLILFGSVMLLSTSFIACNSASNPPQATSNAMVPALPVFAVDTSSVTVYTDYPAELQGQQNVDVRPMVDGFIGKIHVDEGATVKKGQVLFSIIAPQYEQLVRTAEAAIESAKAEVSAAELQILKTKSLVEKDIISKFDLQSAELSLKAKKAVLAQANASLINAQVNLSYTQVKSPVNGVIGTIPYKVGAIVSSNSPNPLTTVSNIDQIYAYFSLNEKQLLALAQLAGTKSLSSQILAIPAVSLRLSDGQEYEQTGKIEMVSGQINTLTGAASLRAVFPNPKGLLRTGGSATIRIPQLVQSALLVPQKSTSDIQGKKFVYLINDSAKVSIQPIEINLAQKGNYYIVNEGLKVGNKIILEGFSSLKEGDLIKPLEKSADSIYKAAKN